VLIDDTGEISRWIASGICGTRPDGSTRVGILFTDDGVQIADRELVEAGLRPSTEGTVGFDRMGVVGLGPDDTVAIDASTLVGEERLGVAGCLDVTIHAADSGSDGVVVPTVTVTADGEAVALPEPTDQNTSRTVAQPAESVVTWPYGPFDLTTHAIDAVSVSTEQGTIASWDVSARHCLPPEAG
jgi:hypothetical protein